MKIIIPTTLSDITLGQYQKYLERANTIKEGENVSDEQLIHIFCNIPLQDVLEMPMNVYNQALEGIVQSLNGLGKDYPLTNKVEVKGKTYGFIPNLEEITYGENKDLTQYLQKWDTMHLAMAVLYRPISITSFDTYNITKYSGTSNERDNMLDMPLDIVLGAQLFFYNLTKALLLAIPNYLEQVVEDKSKERMQGQSTKQTGEDMMNCIASLRETLGDLMK